MNKKTNAGTGLPLGPVIVTGLSAIAGVVLLAIEQPAPGVLVCLLGMAAGFALWMREISAQEQGWRMKLAAAESASQTAAASKPAGASASVISNEWFSSVEGQLSSARSQVEAAVNDLGRTLGQLRGRLQDAQQAAAQACETLDSSGAGVAGEVQGRLDAMLESINQSLTEKTAIFEEVRGFVNATDELARMASSVEELAAKTNLLALNAAIEAARAGEEGRGFSIVADEVRKLSMLSAETGQQIRQRVQDISAAARRAGEGADRMQGSDARLLDHAHSTVSEVVQTFGRATGPLQSVARQISDQASQAAGDVDQVESGLGFQSDVSALIASVDDSVRALRGQIASGGDIDMRAVMRPLSERAAVPASRPVSRSPSRAASTPAAPRAAASAPASGSSGGGLDITFF